MSSEKYLRKIYLFEPFTDAMIKALGEKTKFLQCATGQVLIEQGKMNQSLWMLIKGTAKVYEVDGKRKIEIFSIKPGDIFGELSYADTLPASATVEAGDDAVVLRVKFADLEDVLQKQPLIKSMMLRKMIRIISQRLRKANESLRTQLKMQKAESSGDITVEAPTNTLKSIEISFGGLKATGQLKPGVDPKAKVREASGKYFEGQLDDLSSADEGPLFDMDDLSGIKKLNLEPFKE